MEANGLPTGASFHRYRFERLLGSSPVHSSENKTPPLGHVSPTHRFLRSWHHLGTGTGTHLHSLSDGACLTPNARACVSSSLGAYHIIVHSPFYVPPRIPVIDWIFPLLRFRLCSSFVPNERRRRCSSRICGP